MGTENGHFLDPLSLRADFKPKRHGIRNKGSTKGRKLLAAPGNGLHMLFHFTNDLVPSPNLRLRSLRMRLRRHMSLREAVGFEPQHLSSRAHLCPLH